MGDLMESKVKYFSFLRVFACLEEKKMSAHSRYFSDELADKV